MKQTARKLNYVIDYIAGIPFQNRKIVDKKITRLALLPAMSLLWERFFPPKLGLL
jgi:hypothetical protein